MIQGSLYKYKSEESWYLLRPGQNDTIEIKSLSRDAIVMYLGITPRRNHNHMKQYEFEFMTQYGLLYINIDNHEMHRYAAFFEEVR